MSENDAQCPKCGSREYTRDDDSIMFECHPIADANTMEVDSQSPQCFRAAGKLISQNDNGEVLLLDESDL